MRTAVYIDGFNLYYWLKSTPYRWLDLQKLALSAIHKPDKQHEIVAVKYFTARVSDNLRDREKSTRQDVYLRALRAVIPCLSVHFGEFRRQKKQMPRAHKGGKVGKNVWVWHTEEKGSDVNLAVELVHDAWSNAYDMAVVVSNDSDLEHAVRIVKKKGRTVGVLVRGDAKTISLKKVASFTKGLTEGHLQASLLPRHIPGTRLRIPEYWARMEDEAGVRP